MGRALVAVGALLALCFAVLGIAVFASRTEDRVAIDGPLSERISRAIALASRQDGEVDLARVATFPWDRALIVEPGTPRSRISDALGFEWKGDVGFQTGELLVFVDRDAVARFADYRARDGSPACGARSTSLRAIERPSRCVVSWSAHGPFPVTRRTSDIDTPVRPRYKEPRVAQRTSSGR